MPPTVLGKNTPHPQHYTPEVLHPIPRSEARTRLNLTQAPHGIDHWHAWELSWLTKSGKPTAAIGEFFFNATSKNIVESKSLKLYLNSLNNETYTAPEEVASLITRDLSKASGTQVKVQIHNIADLKEYSTSTHEGASFDSLGLTSSSSTQEGVSHAAPDITALASDSTPTREGTSLDNLDITTLPPEPTPTLLRTSSNKVENITLHTDLFRSNCPVTNQPDWASVEIRYTGPQIAEAPLLEYLLSYRHHQAFHEECAERIYHDIQTTCHPTHLHIALNFLRRGGLDINVYRSTAPLSPPQLRRRLLRQ